MLRENEMRQRADDTAPGALDPHASIVSHKIVRDIPMWSVYSVLGGMLVIAAGMYFGLQRQAELMTEVRADVRNLTTASAARDHAMVEIKSEVRLLGARTDDTLRRVEDVARRTGELERKVR
jgi:hypothetical protein